MTETNARYGVQPITSFTKVILVFSIFLVSGCGTLGTVKSDVPEKQVYLRTLIQPGITSHSEVSKLLGNPLLKSGKWSVEVYRAAEGSDVTWELAGIIPVPAGSRDVISYAMMLYDSNGIVKEVDWLLFTGKGSPGDYAAGSAEVGDLHFMVGPDATLFGNAVEYLLLGEDGSKAALFQDAPFDSCQITFSLHNGVDQVLIDNKSILEDAPGENIFIQYAVQPGEHTLTMKTPVLGYRPREFTSEYSCEAGDSHYVHLDVKIVPTYKKGVFVDAYKNEGRIHINETPPDFLLGDRKLLYQSGEWQDTQWQ